MKLFIKTKADIIIHLLFTILLMTNEIISIIYSSFSYSLYFLGDAITLGLFTLYIFFLLATKANLKSSLLCLSFFFVFIVEISFLFIFRYSTNSNKNIFLLLSPFSGKIGHYWNNEFIITGYYFYPSFLLHLLQTIVVTIYSIKEIKEYRITVLQKK